MAQTKGIEVCLTSSISEDPPGLIGDPFRVKQVLLNLLSNAVKFTPKGNVTVSWKLATLPGYLLRITLDVSDTGIGVPASKVGYARQALY